MFYTRKWFLAAMLTGGALALAGCDDSGISQDTYNKAKQNAAEQKSLVAKLASEKKTAEAKLTAPMIRAANSNVASAGGAVLDGISGFESNDNEMKTVDVNYVYHSPQVTITTVDIASDEESTSKLDMSFAAPIGGEYYGFSFDGRTGQFEKAHVVLYSDKRVGEADYLAYGVWLTEPILSAGEQSTVKHRVGAYATGGDPFMGEVENLEGEATYEGSAVGIYGKREVDSTTSDVGSFTADASLTAMFGKQFKVYGYVMNFMEKGDDLEWKVKLDYIGEPDPFSGTTEISKTGMDRDMEGEGTWKGQFYGKLPSNHPGSFAGTFNTKTGTPAQTSGDQGFLGIVGAFGAKKVMP